MSSIGKALMMLDNLMVVIWHAARMKVTDIRCWWRNRQSMKKYGYKIHHGATGVGFFVNEAAARRR